MWSPSCLILISQALDLLEWTQVTDASEFLFVYLINKDKNDYSALSLVKKKNICSMLHDSAVDVAVIIEIIKIM